MKRNRTERAILLPAGERNPLSCDEQVFLLMC